MHLNPLLPATALAATTALATATGAAAPSDHSAIRNPQSAFPNIVLIISDQMSARALPIYGNAGDAIQTPNMARLAREGATFDNSICTAPYCSPTRSSLVTGRYPVSTGIITNVEINKGNGPLNPKETLTEAILFDKGYATGHFGKWHLGVINSWPCYADKANARDIYDRTYFGGFDAMRAALHPTPAPAKPGEVLITPNPKQNRGYGIYQPQFMHDKLTNAPEDMRRQIESFGRLGTPPELYNWTLVTKNGTDFIRAHKDAPFMVTISIGPPHPEWAIPDPWYSRVDPAKIPLTPSAFTHPERYLGNHGYKLGQYLGEQGTREKMRCYYAMIAFVDDMVGRVLQTLDDCGIAQNTLVVFISDHGDPIATQGFLYDKTIPDFLEEQLRVPTLMRLPGVIPAGKKIETTFSSIDLAPTLRDYTGVADAPTAYPVQGRTFRPLLEGREKDDATNIGFAVSQRQEARSIRGEIDGKIYIYSKMFSVPAAGTPKAAPADANAPAKPLLNAKGKPKTGVKAAAKAKAGPAINAHGKTNPGSSYEQLFNLTDDPWQLKNEIDNPAYAAIKARLQSEFNKYADRAGDRHIEDLPAKGLATWGNFRNVPPDKTAAGDDDE